MSRHAPLAAVREALAGRPAWLVGGAVRDELLGRATDDVDVAVEGDPREPARALARATGGAAFRLSGEFGAWRVVGPGHAWHVDLVALREDGIEGDLGKRDFSINAMAEPLDGGELLDPFGGRMDLRLGGCAWSRPRRWPRTRCARCAPSARPSSSGSRSTAPPRRRSPAARRSSTASRPSGSSASSSASSPRRTSATASS